MAQLTFTGAEEFCDKLLALGMHGQDIQKAALYDGAGVVADALREAVMTIPDSVRGPKPYIGLLPGDKEDLAAAITIAKFETRTDEVNTAVSFAGYTRRTEKGYPNGVPVAMLARSLESGSSNRARYPFARHAINAAKAAAYQAMDKAAHDKMEEIMKGK